MDTQRLDEPVLTVSPVTAIAEDWAAKTTPPRSSAPPPRGKVRSWFFTNAEYAPIALSSGGFAPRVEPPLYRRLSKRGKITLAFVGIGLIALIVALIVTLTRHSVSIYSTAPSCIYSDYRLPGTVVPSAYDITLLPSFDASTSFTGRVKISATTKVVSGMDDQHHCIQVHSRGLRFQSVLINGVAAAGVTYDDAVNQRATLWVPDTVQRQIAAGGGVALDITYSGELGHDGVMYGLYRSTYQDDTRANVNIVATQFEATYARWAFPSFDEPAFKASFAVTLDGVPADYTALGNMPAATQGPGTPTPGGAPTTKVVFQPTPRMSTYLVALVAAPLVSVSGTYKSTDGSTKTVSVWAVKRSDNKQMISYALSAGLDNMPYYESLFKAPFPLPKQDMIAVPDFAAGAMENWGLVTYRETALLGNTTVSSQSELMRIAVVVAHELAHQWFGDLVTMEWWSALFLNEGFATRVEFLGTDHFQPSFQMGRQFINTDFREAMTATAFGRARQLQSTVTSSAEIEAQFDGVAYSFGGSILYMLQAFLDRTVPGAFFGGVASYIQAHKFGNAEPTALWSSFAAAANNPSLAGYLAGYTQQVGYPLVTIDWQTLAMAQAGSGVLTVSQQRHFMSTYSQQVAPPSATTGVWWIPLTLAAEHPAPGSPALAAVAAAASGGGFNKSTWSVPIGSPSNPFVLQRDGYVKANVNGTGFYRVAYPADFYPVFAASLKGQLAAQAPSTVSYLSGPLSAADRSGLIDDVMTLARGGNFAARGIDTQLALSFASSWLGLELSYEVWMPAIGHLKAIRKLLFPDPLPTANPPVVTVPATNQQCLINLAAFSNAMLVNVTAALGFDGSTQPLDVLLRSAVLTAGATFDSAFVVSAAKKFFNDPKGPAAIPADLQTLVFATVVAHDDAQGTAYQQLLALGKSATSTAIKLRYFQALANARDPVRLQQTLDLSLSSDVRSQDTVSLVSAVASNPLGKGLAWAFLKYHWSTFFARYGSGGFAFSSLIGVLTAQFQSAAYVDDMAAFFTGKDVSAATLELQQSQETVQMQIAWVQKQLQSTCTWLQGWATAQ